MSDLGKEGLVPLGVAAAAVGMSRERLQRRVQARLIAGEFRNGTVRGFAAGELVAEHYRSHQVAGAVPTWLTSALPEGATPAEFSEGMLAGK